MYLLSIRQTLRTIFKEENVSDCTQFSPPVQAKSFKSSKLLVSIYNNKWPEICKYSDLNLPSLSISKKPNPKQDKKPTTLRKRSVGYEKQQSLTALAQSCKVGISA